MSEDDEKRLKILEECAYMFISNPLDRAFYHVEKVADNKVDLRASVRILAQALIEIKRSLQNENH